jgi:aminoglycoside phosphotransferase (APT) family kinase protein
MINRLNLSEHVDGRFTLDPQLPALSLIFDLQAVARLFQEQSPITINRCRLQEAQYRPSISCVATYELIVERPDSPPYQTIGVIEITPAGPQQRLFDTDPQLPWLAMAVNRERMSRRFAALLPDGEGVEEFAISPIRYKPGSRCALRYRLRTSSGEQLFFGKLLARDGDSFMDTVTALYRTSRTTSAMPRIARPLAYWPEVQMVVQASIAGGAELNERAFDPAEEKTARERWLHQAGFHLAGLHTAVEVEGRRRTIEDDLRELDEYKAPMARMAPALATRFEALIEEIATLAGSQDEPPPVASHGAFRTDQMMIQDGRLVLIDLDSYCWANRARDAGNFLAYLSWKAIRRPQQAAFIERAGRLFLDGYATIGPALDNFWLSLYRAASMLKIIGRRFRTLSYKEWPLTPQLLNTAVTIIQEPFTS